MAHLIPLAVPATFSLIYQLFYRFLLPVTFQIYTTGLQGNCSLQLVGRTDVISGTLV